MLSISSTLSNMNATAAPPIRQRLEHTPLRLCDVETGGYCYAEVETQETVFRFDQGGVVGFRRDFRHSSQLVGFAVEEADATETSPGSDSLHADAVSDSCQSRLRGGDFDTLGELDEIIEEDQGEAIRRKFAWRKKLSVDLNCDNPIGRVAAFFLFVSRQNELQGMDPVIVNESWNCGVVSNYLNLDISGLASALITLEHSALIERIPPFGLRLTDMGGLERLANGERGNRCAGAGISIDN